MSKQEIPASYGMGEWKRKQYACRKKRLLSNGCVVEFFWHVGMKSWGAEVTTPDHKFNMVFSKDRKAIVGKIRLAMAGLMDPNVTKVLFKLKNWNGNPEQKKESWDVADLIETEE